MNNRTAEDVLEAARIDVEGTMWEPLASATLDNAMKYLETGRIAGARGVAYLWAHWPYEIETLIARYLKAADGSQLDIPCDRFYRGWAFNAIDKIKPPESFRLMDAWSNGFCEVYTDGENRAIFTICEGDLDMTIDLSEEEYEARLKSAAKFYARSAAA